MIQNALRHFPGIGPVRLAKFQAAGISCWSDLLARPELIPPTWRARIVAECERCVAAESRADVRYFVEHFAPQDKWRILAHFFEQTTFFDIETEGLDYNAPVTVIACWHRGSLRTFVEYENLDEFLELLDEVVLLASFNGSSFDVPRLLDAFHIPHLPCPHVDLRWICHHHGWRGGLKEIADRLAIHRPSDLNQVDGAMAVHLWNRWRMQQDKSARAQLLRYCGSDVVLSVLLGERITGRDLAEQELWSHLPAKSSCPLFSLAPALSQFRALAWRSRSA